MTNDKGVHVASPTHSASAKTQDRTRENRSEIAFEKGMNKTADASIVTKSEPTAAAAFNPSINSLSMQFHPLSYITPENPHPLRQLFSPKTRLKSAKNNNNNSSSSSSSSSSKNKIHDSLVWPSLTDGCFLSTPPPPPIEEYLNFSLSSPLSLSDSSSLLLSNTTPMPLTPATFTITPALIDARSQCRKRGISRDSGQGSDGSKSGVGGLPSSACLRGRGAGRYRDCWMISGGGDGCDMNCGSGGSVKSRLRRRKIPEPRSAEELGFFTPSHPMTPQINLFSPSGKSQPLSMKQQVLAGVEKSKTKPLRFRMDSLDAEDSVRLVGHNHQNHAKEYCGAYDDDDDDDDKKKMKEGIDDKIRTGENESNKPFPLPATKVSSGSTPSTSSSRFYDHRTKSSSCGALPSMLPLSPSSSPSSVQMQNPSSPSLSDELSVEDLPSILCLTSATDDRVVPMHSFKFAAALQTLFEANKLRNPTTKTERSEDGESVDFRFGNLHGTAPADDGQTNRSTTENLRATQTDGGSPRLKRGGAVHAPPLPLEARPSMSYLEMTETETRTHPSLPPPLCLPLPPHQLPPLPPPRSPVALLRVTESTGHGLGKGTEKAIAELVDIFSFIDRTVPLKWTD